MSQLKAVLCSFVALSLVVGAAGCTKKSVEEDGKTIYAAVPAKIKGTDPIYGDDLYSSSMLRYTYEPLFEYHYLKRPYELIPALAESLPTVSKDGRTYTIKLKKGVVFQDDPAFKETKGKGRELTSEDVIYSYKRLADPKNLSPGWWIFDGRIAGLNEWRAEASASGKPADYSKPIEGLKALDRYTVQIQLTQPSHQFAYYLAMPFASVVPREAVEHYGKDFIRNPVGTGPFKLVREETNLNSKLVWVRNPTYRKELYPSEGEPEDKEAGRLVDAGQQLPLSDKVVVQVFVESQPQWLNFMAGKLDVTSIPKDNFAQAITPSKDLSPDLKNKGITLSKSPGLDITHVTFNMEHPILGKNKYLRQAMSLAYDIGPVIELFYNGRAVPAQGPIPPGLAGYDEKFKNPYRQFDLEKAKELLKKAGYPEGKGLPVLEYATSEGSTNRQMSEYLVNSMAKIGVQVKPVYYTWPEFQNVVKNKKGQLFAFAWGADYPDAENFLQLFYSKNVSPGPNDSNYANPTFDKLYEQSLKLPDSPARTKLYQQMVQILVDDAPWIWGVHRENFGLTQAWYKNYKWSEFDQGHAKYRRIDLETKKKLQEKFN